MGDWRARQVTSRIHRRELRIICYSTVAKCHSWTAGICEFHGTTTLLVTSLGGNSSSVTLQFGSSTLICHTTTTKLALGPHTLRSQRNSLRNVRNSAQRTNRRL